MGAGGRQESIPYFWSKCHMCCVRFRRIAKVVNGYTQRPLIETGFADRSKVS
jgi:hypothetical protein